MLFFDFGKVLPAGLSAATLLKDLKADGAATKRYKFSTEWRRRSNLFAGANEPLVLRIRDLRSASPATEDAFRP